MTIAQNNNQKHDAPIELDQLSRHFVKAFPAISRQEQQIALAIYRLLAQGKPVSIAQVANAVGGTDEVISSVIDGWPGVFFENGDLIGFWGITIREMQHQLNVDNQHVYAWCAWDALFIPELLNAEVKVVTSCPETGEKIELEVTPEQVKAVNNNDVMVSFIQPTISNLTEDITSSFCHFVYFLSSEEAGKRWCVKHPNTFLLTLTDAFSLGRMVNAKRYSLTLN